MTEFERLTPEGLQKNIAAWEATPHDAGGGGGGGTDNYNALSNKPQINGVTLEGNRSLSQLGAASSGALTALQTDVADAVTKANTAQTQAANALTVANAANNAASGADSKADSALTQLATKAATSTVTALATRVTAAEGDIATLQTEKATNARVAIAEGNIDDIAANIGDMNDLAPSSDTLVEAINKAYNHGGGGGGGGSGTDDYSDLSHKPSINDVTLEGNKTLAQLGIASADDLTDVDDRVTVLENKPDVNPTQVETMPVASGDYNIVQYVGATTANYTKGYFYRSTPSVVSGELVYSWQQIMVQPSSNDYEGMTNKPSINTVELTGDKSAADLDLQKTLQYTTMPAADATNLGRVVQYVGATNTDYTQGYFYQSSYDSENASYKWVYKPVTADSSARVTALENAVGDITDLPGTATNVVQAIVALSRKDIKTFTYTEPNLVITYNDDTTSTLNVKMIIDEIQLGELANVLDTTIADTNVLQYDSALKAYKPYDIVAKLAELLQAAKDYADTAVSESIVAGAYVCDTKPEYDAENDTVIYKQGGVTKTTTQCDARFYYHDSEGDSFCSSWINDIEFTFSVAEVEFSDYVKTEDVVSTYTGEEVDKSKIPNIAALDALLTLIRDDYLSTYVSEDDIIDALTSQDATKVLSAKQGYVLKGQIDTKQDIVQVSVLPTADSAHLNMVLQTVPNGKFWRCEYNSTDDVYSWEEVKYAPNMDTSMSETSTNPVTNAAITAALGDKQDKTLETPLEIGGEQVETVEAALDALNNKAVDVDTVLDTESENPIANSAVATAVDELATALAKLDKAAVSVLALPTASETLAGMVRFNLTDNRWYVCEEDGAGGYKWTDLTPVIPEVDLSDYETSWTGTRAEWNGLSDSEQEKYDIVNFTDEAASGDTVVVDEVTAGNLNPVTSNAVATAVSTSITSVRNSIYKSAEVYAMQSAGYIVLSGLVGKSAYQSNSYLISNRNGELILLTVNTSSSTGVIKGIEVTRLCHGLDYIDQSVFEYDEESVAFHVKQYSLVRIIQVSGIVCTPSGRFSADNPALSDTATVKTIMTN